jgi:hypothetical protein
MAILSAIQAIGVTYVGQPGDIHADVLDRHNLWEIGGDEIPFWDIRESGFWDTLSESFLSRKQATEVLLRDYPEDVKEAEWSEDDIEEGRELGLDAAMNPHSVQILP